MVLPRIQWVGNGLPESARENRRTEAVEWAFDPLYPMAADAPGSEVPTSKRRQPFEKLSFATHYISGIFTNR